MIRLYNWSNANNKSSLKDSELSMDKLWIQCRIDNVEWKRSQRRSFSQKKYFCEHWVRVVVVWLNDSNHEKSPLSLFFFVKKVIEASFSNQATKNIARKAICNWHLGHFFTNIFVSFAPGIYLKVTKAQLRWKISSTAGKPKILS